MSATPTIPEDVVNRALDECGVEEIGDLQEGSRAANAALRIYWPTLRQVHTAAHWNFARAYQQLNQIAGLDANGVAVSDYPVPSPWSFIYEWPVDCIHARWVPEQRLAGLYSTVRPARFLVGSVPIPNDGTEWDDIEGHDPDSTRVIFTNVANATLVYTKLMFYPDAWDPLFEQAMVAVLAARLAMPCIQDKKFALTVRRDNIQIAKDAINIARVRDGNEGWTVPQHIPDWISIRNSSGFNLAGVFTYGYDALPGFDDIADF